MNLDIESVMKTVGIEPTVRNVAGVRSILATVDQVRSADRRNTIVYAAYDGEGQAVMRGETSSCEALLELNMMTNALELMRAIDRGIDITAADMWTHLTKSLPPDAPSANSTMVRSALKARDAANKRCDSLSARNEFLEREFDAMKKIAEDYKKKVAMFDWLIEQCGSTRDGSDTPVRLTQDDATHERFVIVGEGRYIGRNFQEAIQSGMKGT